MKSKLLIILLLISVGFVAYFSYPIIKSRYFKDWVFKPQQKTIINNDSADMSSEEENGESHFFNKDIQDTTDESGTKPNISAADCDNECKDFSANQGNLIYCREVCGLSELEKKPEALNDCNNQSGIQKDYCFKDLAIKNKDFKTCDQISDEGIKKACKNRITEDIIETETTAK